MLRSLMFIFGCIGCLYLLVGSTGAQSASNSTLTRAGDVQSSDVNLKLDIRDFEDGIRQILLLKPRRFKYREDMTGSLGFIAQELQNQFPELVTGKNGEKRVNYALLTAPIVKAIQELYADLNETRSQLTEMQKENAELKTQLNAIKRHLCKTSPGGSNSPKFCFE